MPWRVRNNKTSWLLHDRKKKMRKIIILIPVYNDWESLKKLIEAQKGGRNLKLEDILKKKRPQTKRGRKKKNSTLIKSSISELSEEKNQ